MTAAELLEAGPEDAPAFFSRGYATSFQGPIVAFLANGWPLPHPRVLMSMRYLIVAFTVLMIVAGRRRDGVALWILASAAAALSIYSFPPVAALTARFITPWQLYRFAWLLPVPLMVAWLTAIWIRGERWAGPKGVALGLLLGFIVAGSTYSTLLRTGPSGRNERQAVTVEQLEGYSGVIIARSDIMNAAVTRWPEILAISHRGYSSMSNAFPVSRQDEALERMADVRRFFRKIPTAERLSILDRYEVRYIVIHRDEEVGFDLEGLSLDRVAAIGQGNVLYQWQPSAGRP